jgi:hypothetical protein
MTSLSAPLIVWIIPASERASDSRARSLQQKGWKGLHLNSPSPYEHQAVETFLKNTYPEYYYPQTNIVMDDSLGVLGNADLPEDQLWLPQDASEHPLFAFLTSIPPRTIEFSVSVLTPEMEDLLSSINSLVIEYEDDIEFDTLAYLISMEDQPGLVRRLQEMGV